VFGVCVFRDNSITSEPCCVQCVSELEQTTRFVVVTKQLSSCVATVDGDTYLKI